jgi:Arc/MetJ family transcription regulator
MSWVFFARAMGRTGKVVALAMDLHPSPELWLEDIAAKSPFPKLRLAAMEGGSLDLLGRLKERFKAYHMNGPWYKVAQPIEDYIRELPEPNRNQGGSRRVTIEIPPEDFAALAEATQRLGTKTKSRFIRQAYRFYLALSEYKARGYLIQAVKGGQLIQFPDLNDIRSE